MCDLNQKSQSSLSPEHLILQLQLLVYMNGKNLCKKLRGKGMNLGDV
ncbi:hypothetical protein ACJIZ3_008651 [Penstemon smallii]|uniref:Uncharacterized protein n=1 Tax=Penstemon smallii TaxID=265156 RepID=A0ABD3TAC2_9LAMI